MSSELERIAGRLRFLSDQAQQHRRPVVEASQKLRDAASAVATLRFDQPEGPPITAPPSLAAHLVQAADRAREAVVPLTQTAELLRTFAARLAAGGAASGAAGGAASGAAGGAPGGAASPGGQPTGTGPSAPADPGAPGGGYPQPDSAPARPRPAGADRRLPGLTTSSGARPGEASRYGRYPTTTATRFAPGNRSYEVGSQPQ
ncbi:hypothetical protein [Cryptosporangium aurantiacum]|uniref:Uncharacterized protein n=1 Tax=Cryptosporangium aurantiacum TaxID=134849 RepID=A0A1M7RKX6_9ACTN|nr:hypothetical protein [Cryptosporangium aurantiacum]SHN46819.1 hypothetical protein SAMN05443668_11851 [Cryptosporangium aurantiacum]